MLGGDGFYVYKKVEGWCKYQRDYALLENAHNTSDYATKLSQSKHSVKYVFQCQ